MSEEHEAVKQLQSMFPSIDSQVLACVWQQCAGDTEAAIEVLLGQNAAWHEPQQRATQAMPTVASDAGEQQQHEQEEEEDEALARQLQAEWELDDETEFEWSRADSDSGATVWQRRSPSDSGVLADGRVSLEKLVNDAGSREQLEQLMRRAVMELVEGQQLEMAPIEETIETAKLGRMEFGSGAIRLERVQMDEVKVQVDEKLVTVRMSGMTGQLNEFEWHYEKQSFPRLRDNGQATARLRGGSTEVTARLTDSGGVEVGGCEVRLRDIDIEISGTAAKVIYKLLVAGLVRLLRGRLERQLSQMIRELFESIL